MGSQEEKNQQEDQKPQEPPKLQESQAFGAEGDIVAVDSEIVAIDNLDCVSDADQGADEAEEFAQKIIKRAASLNGVRIQRDVFLRTEIKKYCPDADANLAVETTPIAAGIAPDKIDEMAKAAIDFETKKCAGLSFLAGIPGGIAMAGTVPADLAQYFAHVMRIEQKLAYLYGWQTFLDEKDEVDDETVMELVLLMGVMMQVGGAASSISKFAAKVAQQSVAKTIQRQALTKTTFYPIMKSVLRVIGIQLTKETFAKTVSKAVPVVGGAVSGGLTYASFKPGAERLRKYLRALPVSGIDTSEESDLEGEASLFDSVSSAVADGAQKAGTVVAEGAQVAGAAVAEGAKAAVSFFGSLGKKK